MKRSPASGWFFFYSSIQEIPQVALKRLFGRRLSVRGEPAFEVPDPDLVLDFRLFDGNRDRRILMDSVDPIALTKNVQSASYGFIETARRNLDGMFRAVRVETRYPASAKTHIVTLPFRFSFARSLTRLRGRE
jgi:hypothetical protein